MSCRPVLTLPPIYSNLTASTVAGATMVVDGTQVKVLAWYDNEWGYVNRPAELTTKVAASLSRARR